MAGLDDNGIRWRGRPSIALRLVTLAGLLLFSLPAPRSSATTTSGLAEAVRVQRSRLEAAPRSVAVMNDLANLLVLAGDNEEAEQLYRSALEIDPERVETIYNLALLQAETGRRKLARQSFQEALKVDADHAWSHYQLGTLAAARGNRNQAIGYYTRAFRLEPRLTVPEFNPHILDNDLVIPALLSARAADAASAAVPRIYQNPERVRGLLFPPLAAVPEEAPESPRSTTPDGGGIRRGGQGPGGQARWRDEAPAPPVPEPARSEPETEPGAGRDPAPDQGAADGRQVPSGRAPGQPIAPAPAGATAVPLAGDPGPSGRESPGREVMPAQPAEPRPVPEEPPPATSPESAPPEFEPDLGSTGRLELRLVPTPQDRLAALAIAPR